MGMDDWYGCPPRMQCGQIDSYFNGKLEIEKDRFLGPLFKTDISGENARFPCGKTIKTYSGGSRSPTPDHPTSDAMLKSTIFFYASLFFCLLGARPPEVGREPRIQKNKLVYKKILDLSIALEGGWIPNLKVG